MDPVLEQWEIHMSKGRQARLVSVPSIDTADLDRLKIITGSGLGSKRGSKAEAYSNLLGLEGLVSTQEIKDRCRLALSDVGASDAFCEFFADVLQCEFEINATLHKLHQTLGLDRLDGIGQDPEKLLRVTQELTRNFNTWRGELDALHQRGKDLPPLKIDANKFNTSTVLKALCSLQTREVMMAEGDEITITDASQPNKLRIRNKTGQEGYVPALCCVLPSPDKNALTATERLRIQLLASWVESVKKVRRLMMECLLTTSKMLTTNWRQQINTGGGVPKERVARRFRRLSDTITRQAPRWDLHKLHQALFSLEKELSTWSLNGTEVNDMIDMVAALDKSVLCYQMLTKQLHLFRHNMEVGARPIRIVDHWSKLAAVRKGRSYRYFEMKMTVEEVETVEEVIETIPEKQLLPLPSSPRVPVSPGGTSEYGIGHKNETVQADQITSSSLEEKRRFVITGVVDPRNDLMISIQDAVARGVVNQETGMYMNPVTGVGVPIQEAMNNGQIQVEQVTTTKTKEETKAIGLVTIRTTVDNRQYIINGVVHPVTGQQLSPDEARNNGIISETDGIYKNIQTGDVIPLENAIQGGWVLVEYEPEPEITEYDTKIYAVNAVVDQKQRKKVPFYEAVKRGLIDRETGTYINNVTGEAIYVVEAIQRGFLKAKVVEDATGLDIDAENKVVIERMEKIRKNVIKPMGIINAFKMAAGIMPPE